MSSAADDTVPRDLAVGSYSDAAPWIVEPDALVWRRGLDRRRTEVQGAVPGLLTPGRIPPLSRTLATLWHLGRAIVVWAIRERGGANSRAGISRRMRRACEALGPTYIKLGQIISSGEGVFPDELVSEFRLCRDRVPAEPFEVVKAIVEADLGAPLSSTFTEFDPTPLAAASIAQVHRAVLRSGPDGAPVEVVVKVQRPAITQLVHRDIRILAWLAPHLVGRIPVAALANPPALVELFAQTIVEELDFRLEAENMVDVARSFIELDQTGYVVPRPHPEHVTERVLVMERLVGFAFDDIEGMAAAGVDLQQVVRTGMIGFMEGCMIHGIFHGDLHGGNLFVLPDSRTALLDYGIVARLPESRRIAFLRLLITGTTGDIEGQVAAIRDLGALPADTDLRQVIDDLDLEAPTIDPTTLDPDELVDELNRIVKALLGYGASMPKELMLFAKNLVFVDSAIATMTPEVDLLGEIAHLAQYFALNHGQRIATEVGIDPTSYTMDLSSVKAGFGVTDEVDSLTYRELQQRRELISRRLQSHTQRGSLVRRTLRAARSVVGRKAAIALVIVAIVASSCSSDPSIDQADPSPVATTMPEPTPPPTAEPTPPPSAEPSATSAPTTAAPDDSIDIATALERSSSGLLTVDGFLVVADDTPHLCSALTESLPPQCGEPSAIVEGLDLQTVPGLVTSDGVAWTPDHVQLTAILVDGLLDIVDVTRE